ncbi:hypothetical protein BGX24_006132 [Mortierella sp. AD032]|nr:hypothetical protein BGX24_006132 [Mortierella sp. AD032]
MKQGTLQRTTGADAKPDTSISLISLCVDNLAILRMAFNKIFSFFLVAVLALVIMSQGAEAATIPSWCNCNNDQSKTKKACSIAGGNYDGSSCGLDHIGKYNSFLMGCSQQNGSYKCWH